MSKILKTESYAIILAVILATFSMHAMAQEAGTEQVNSGDTAWVLVCAALVMLMTPAVGLFYGNPGLVLKQLIAIAAVILYSLVVTAIILKVHEATMGLRVKEEHEVEGLDVSQHGEKAYL